MQLLLQPVSCQVFNRHVCLVYSIYWVIRFKGYVFVITESSVKQQASHKQ